MARSSMAATPLVKWAGGKAGLLARIIERVPASFGTYHEPFLGGGAAFFALQLLRLRSGQATTAVLSDTNRELIAMYEAVRDDPESLMRALDCLQPYVLDHERYYAIRAQDAADLTPAEAAARFIYLNKTCYNGLYRVNRRGQFNVPFGRYTRPPRLYDGANLLAVSAALRRATLLCADYHDALVDARAGDFVYLDPPYHPISRTASFTSYTALAFGEGDQRALAQEVRRLTSVGAYVLLSNSDTPLIRELYAGYAMTPVTVGRAINSKGDRRTGARELLVDNYEAMPKKSRSQSSRSAKATALPVDNR